MITTSMGSLPFTDAKVAVDYAFKFNLPFFPELPQLSERELMVGRLEYFYHNRNSQQFCDEAFRKKVLEQRPKKIKWQVICPLTFFRYQRLGLTKEECFFLLKEYIKERLSFFRSFFKEELYLCLDAPGIKFEESMLLELKNFLVSFKEEKTKIGLHFCQKIEKTFKTQGPYFDFCCFDALLNDQIDIVELYGLFSSLIYGIYDFRQPPPQHTLAIKPREDDGISTVCGLSGASEEAVFSCVDYFSRVK